MRLSFLRASSVGTYNTTFLHFLGRAIQMRRIDVQVRIQSNTLTDFVGGQENSMGFYAHTIRQRIASAASQDACWAEEFSTGKINANPISFDYNYVPSLGDFE